MEKKSQLEKDVVKELKYCSDIVSNCAADTFSYNSYHECFDLKMESVIEKIFYIAYQALVEVMGLSDDMFDCCQLHPQRQIGKYRVDFLATRQNSNKGITYAQAVVECDGHHFHERNEPDRRYEKRRDRYLQSKGYKMFHFTGKEIKDDSILCASEVLSSLFGMPSDEIISQVSNFGYDH